MSLRAAACLSLSLFLFACPKKDACNNECSDKQTCCDGQCVNTDNDKLNCGACGNSCADVPNVTPQCSAGRCQLNCVLGYGNCDGLRDNGCEFATLTDINNCGTCNHQCTAANAQALCDNAQCGIGTCDTGYGDCNQDDIDGCEVDTRITRAHCGACGNKCALAHADAGCGDSRCHVTACSPGFANCNAALGQPGDDDGCEINTVTGTPLDGGLVTDCGACGYTCGPGQYCRDSLCRADELLYFGGRTSLSVSAVTNELWKFNLNTRKFQQLAATGSAPPARQQHIAAWDLPRNRMLIFGGADGLGDAWSTSGKMDGYQLSFATSPPAWSAVTTTGDVPPPRYGASYAVDQKAWKLYVFGGALYDAANPPTYETAMSDFYVLDLATLKWTKLQDSKTPDTVVDPDRPTNRTFARAAFDPVGRTFVLYGGTDGVSLLDLNEVWRYSLSAGTWSGASFPPMNVVPARTQGALYDGSPVYLFSGVRDVRGVNGATPQVMGDFLQYAADSDEWTALTAMGPEARFAAGHVARDGVLYLFAGSYIQGAADVRPEADTWAYNTDGGTWRLLNDGGVGSGTTADGGAFAFPTARIFGSLVAR